MNNPELNKFHSHLDVCRQCRENPFNLCGVGQVLIVAAVKEIEEKHPPEPTQERP